MAGQCSPPATALERSRGESGGSVGPFTDNVVHIVYGFTSIQLEELTSFTQF